MRRRVAQVGLQHDPRRRARRGTPRSASSPSTSSSVVSSVSSDSMSTCRWAPSSRARRSSGRIRSRGVVAPDARGASARISGVSAVTLTERFTRGSGPAESAFEPRALGPAGAPPPRASRAPRGSAPRSGRPPPAVTVASPSRSTEAAMPCAQRAASPPSASRGEVADDEAVGHVAHRRRGRDPERPPCRRRCRRPASRRRARAGGPATSLEVADQVAGEVVERAAGRASRRRAGRAPRGAARPRRRAASPSGRGSGTDGGRGRENRLRARGRFAVSPPPAPHRGSSGAILPTCLADEGQVLRHHQDRGRARGRAPRRLGDRAQPLARRARAAAIPATAAEIGAELRRLVEIVGVFVNRDARRDRAGGRGRAADDGPAPWRRGPGLLPRGRAAHRLQGDQGDPRSQRRRRPRRPRPSAPTFTSSTPTARARPAAPARASTGS